MPLCAERDPAFGRKHMKPVCPSIFLILFIVFGAHAQTAPDAAELTKLLNDFMAGASVNDATKHDRFWAEDLIYTRSAGRRVSKSEVMHDVRSTPAPKPGDPKTTFSAEDVHIQQYANTAIVAFRLVGTTETDGGAKRVTNFLNTGTFLKRNGKWQAVSWQATKMPRSEEDSTKEVTDAATAFHKALLAADVKKLASLTDTTFIWTNHDGVQIPRQQLLDQLGSGQLKYAKLETNKVTVAIYGDSAVVRGESERLRSAIPGMHGGDSSPIMIFYSLTLIDQGGGWKAVALHSSRTQ